MQFPNKHDKYNYDTKHLNELLPHSKMKMVVSRFSFETEQIRMCKAVILIIGS